MKKERESLSAYYSLHTICGSSNGIANHENLKLFNQSEFKNGSQNWAPYLHEMNSWLSIVR